MVALHETPVESDLVIETHKVDIDSVCFDVNLIKHIDDNDTQIIH